MIKEISLFDEIEKGGFQTSLITTYNAYLPFYEEVILRKLISKGMHHNTVLMDKNQFLHSVKSSPPRFAGTHYSLFPMHSPGAYHPKILFLAGKKKGVLLIGSHNLTLSGFGYNRELTNVIRYSESEPDEEALSIIRSTWFQVNEWFKSQSFPESLTDMIRKIEGFAPWLRGEIGDVGNDVFVLSSQANKQSLFKQLSENIDGEVNRVILTGAFFDSELKFLQEIRKILNPTEIFVGVDPDTVSFPGEKRNVENVRFVNSSRLGIKKNGAQKSYLHAKSIFIEQKNGTVLLVTGSANPSNPAWLMGGLDGNTEMVLCRKDDLSIHEAETIGLLDIPNMDKIEDEEWQTISKNWSENIHRKNDKSSGKIGLAMATYDGLIFNIDSIGLEKIIQCELLNSEKILIKKIEAEKDGSGYKIKTDRSLAEKTTWIQCYIQSEQYIFLVHHEREILERSKTGTQRRLKNALSSISTDSPDIGVVIDCVSKIIFGGDDTGTDRSKKIKLSNKDSEKKKEVNINEGSPLSISLNDDPKSNRKKFRLKASDDLSWLFDTLLYHLNIDFRNIEDQEDLDNDPNEEELVGSDDDFVEKKEIKALSILNQCHNKIRLLVRRMLKQFEALRNEVTELDDVVLKLTGTLALLRHLRECDGKLFWIPKGHTSFPKELRQDLLQGIIEVFFDGKFSLTFENKINLKVYGSEELARLKGLIVWLAWDSGIKLQAEQGFNEDFEERENRLRKNGIMIHLAQLIGGDEIVKSEVLKSMMLIEKTEPDWLKWINDADKRLRKLLNSIDAIDKLEKYNRLVPVGGIAIDKVNPSLGARIIGRIDYSNVEVINFLPEKRYHRLNQKNSIFLHFETVMKGVGV